MLEERYRPIGGYSTGMRQRVAVNDVTLSIGPGVTGLLGPNGAGKSTLINMMGGFLAPSAGTVTLDGEPVWRNEGIYRQVGLVPEREAMYDVVSGWQFLLANARLHGLPDPEAAARRALETVQMTDFQDRDLGTYSKGMKQRIKIATALVHDPPVLLLDEPQRHGPASAAAADGVAAGHGRGRTNGAVQLADPRGGRADRGQHPGDGRGSARRVRRLPRRPSDSARRSRCCSWSSSAAPGTPASG